MNFRTKPDFVTDEHLLKFGEDSDIRFDRWGTIIEVRAFRPDGQFRHTAQRLARDAAAQVRREMDRASFGTAKSQLRLKFLTRVAQVANQMERAE